MLAKGHAAIVTGGGSGLGAATARSLAKAGAKVAVLDINEENAKKVAAEIGGVAVKCDVADAASGEAAVAEARKAHGPSRILINCAGIGIGVRIVGRNGPHPLDQFSRVINVNLIGTFNLMRLAAADMVKLDPMADDERGVIVSTALGAAIFWATPFNLPAAAGLALVISLMGFCGGLVMSAIKRDRGVKDFGTLIAGHGGVLDRIDSLCFAAPVFFIVLHVIAG